MPRIARVVIKDNPHHITQRGNYQQTVFKTDSDYKTYLNWIKEYSQKYHLSILAYCLMPNHVHFIAIPQKEDSLAKTFNTCHMRYSQYFNKKRKIRGHLWQGRFYSCALDEKHLYSATRYVENNPKRSKLVARSEQWKYSSAKAHIKKINDPLLTNIDEVIGIRNWSKYLKEKEDLKVIKSIKANTLTGRPSGSNKFVEELEKRTGLRLRPLAWGRPKK